MPKFLRNPFRTSKSTSATEKFYTRVQNWWRNSMRRRFIAIGAVVAVGAILGSGFAVNSTVVASNERATAAEALTASKELRAKQLSEYRDALEVQAAQRAKDTISGAKVVLSDAKGKTDTKKLSSSVAALGNYTMLTPERVFDLVDQTNAQIVSVTEATDKAERVAAKKAAEKAAAKAAAKKKAEAQAAAAAAAEEAAAEEAEAAAEEAAAEEAAADDARAEQNSAPSRPSGPTDPSGAQAIARDMMASKYGWGGDQFGCLVSLWDRESGWNVNAYNASSGATGIPQALPGSKMASAGSDWETNPATQIAWGLGYIAASYGSPCAAWDHSESAGWY